MITFLSQKVADQLDRYLIATRPHTSGLGREQVAYKPDQAVVELGQAWSGNLDDRDGRVDLIGSVKADHTTSRRHINKTN